MGKNHLYFRIWWQVREDRYRLRLGPGVVGSDHGDISFKLLVELIAGGAVVRTVSPNYGRSIHPGVEAGVCKPVIWRLNRIRCRRKRVRSQVVKLCPQMLA